MTEIAKLVRFRSKINVLLFLILFAVGAWLSMEDNARLAPWWVIGWNALAVFSLLGWVASLGIARGWRFQKISMKLRPGVVIKAIYWFSGLSVLVSGTFTYILFAELRELNWYVAGHFAGSLVVLIMCMSIRYAIDEDMKKRKVCEFC